MAVAGRRSSLLTNLKIYPFAVVTRLMVLSRRETYIFQTLKIIKSVLSDLPYIFDFSGSQSIEAGIERAQTILDTSLQLGLLTGVEGGDRFGGLAPITDSVGTVEESAMNILPFIIGPSTVE